MKKGEAGEGIVRKHLQVNKIATLDELKRLLATDARMTVFRTLRRLGCSSSYSHRGGYYTLREIPEFDQFGLWSFHTAWFSRHGNLLQTTAALVEQAKAGYTAAELEMLLQVGVKHSMLKLKRRGLIDRCKIAGVFVYTSVDGGRRRQQRLMREEREAAAEVGIGMDAELLPEEAKAAIVLFFSLLNEKQRRLYAGLEAAKLGHGGDLRIAELFGLDPHTVAKGRRELLDGNVDRRSVRQGEVGRKRVEKKSPK
jgi:hypothetical protein